MSIARGTRVTTLTEGQEMRLRVWPEPGGEEITVVVREGTRLSVAFAVRGRALRRLVEAVQRFRRRR